MAKLVKTNAMRMLEKLGIAYEALTYPSNGEAVDAVTVAQLMGEPPDRVFKTLVLKNDAGQHFVCVLPGQLELDLKRAAAVFGVKSVHMLAVSDIKPLTGYVRGGCSPVGMKKAFPTAADESALSQPYVLVSGGQIGLQMKLTPQDLVKAAGAKTADITMPPAAP